jgi:hypothetical protein
MIAQSARYRRRIRVKSQVLESDGDGLWRQSLSTLGKVNRISVRGHTGRSALREKNRWYGECEKEVVEHCDE